MLLLIAPGSEEDMHGVFTDIERVNDKCIDVEVKTKVCKSCTFCEKKKGIDTNNTWKESHKCMINHNGSASSIESESVISIFSRSITNSKMRYKTFIGDGDSASYNHVVKSDPYPGLEIKKGECIGHIQKRLGSNLHAMRGLQMFRWETVIW